MLYCVRAIETAMPYYFTCPHCFHKTLIDEQLSGKSGPCVGCGKQVIIPPAPPAKRTDIAPAEDRDDVGAVVIRPRLVSRTTVRLAIFAVAALPVVLVTFWLLGPTMVQLKARRDVTACQQNLKRIAKALNAYASEYGTYPPAVTRDGRGKAMHSWRVLLLPYLGEKQLYSQYDMSASWDAPQNSSLQAQIPSVYVSPANTRAAVGESSYMLVTGAGTLFPAGPPGNPKNIRDGAANTLLVVETNNSRVAWTEPVDLDITRLPAQIGAIGGIGGSHQGGATAVFADGEAAWLPSDTSKAVMDGLLSPAGGEAVQGAWYK
jgi:hypothetical protein